MARVDLIVWPTLRVPPARVLQPDGRPLNLALTRVTTFTRVGSGSRRVLDAIVNMGAPLTVFPENVWRDFQDEIEWFTVPDATAWVNQIGWGGVSAACRVRRIDVELIDIGPPMRSLDPVPTIALFSSAGPDNRILIGIQEGPLIGRRLVIDMDAADGYIEDR